MTHTRRSFLAGVFAVAAAPLVAKLPASTCDRAVSTFDTQGVVDITYDDGNPRVLAFASPNRRGRGEAVVVPWRSQP